MSYAWIIDRDHLAEEERKPIRDREGKIMRDGKVEDDARGITGPSAAPDWMIEFLQVQDPPAGTLYGTHGKADVFVFKLYDDDSILYYTGRMITDEGTTERACYGPLGDFGAGYAGCTSVRYPGHDDMDCS